MVLSSAEYVAPAPPGLDERGLHAMASRRSLCSLANGAEEAPDSEGVEPANYEEPVEPAVHRGEGRAALGSDLGPVLPSRPQPEDSS